MTPINLKLTDQGTRDEAIERLTTYFPFQADGYECTTAMLFDVLVKAAVTQQTIEAICQDLDVVGGETIRGYLKEQVRVDDLHNLERQVNYHRQRRWLERIALEGALVRSFVIRYRSNDN